jgi:hypothetical protein
MAKVKRFPYINIDVLNVYAFNKTTKQCKLWEHLMVRLQKGYRWLMNANFNLVSNHGMNHLHVKGYYCGMNKWLGMP